MMYINVNVQYKKQEISHMTGTPGILSEGDVNPARGLNEAMGRSNSGGARGPSDRNQSKFSATCFSCKKSLKMPENTDFRKTNCAKLKKYTTVIKP